MSNRERPNPDDLLRVVNNEELNEHVGKLRVFLGMSAGVGKTYAMLKAAQQKLSEGVDVIVGVVETHGRSETAALLEGLPTVPMRKIEYRGTTIQEMDIESILKKKPELVIVDELAHSNAPGSRHEKRYQDVYELLDAGIDVFTALNVQHLESRKDSVEAITGISIRETVPDGILDRANLVELVDIAPSELLKRLREGKVYLGDKAEAAAQNFFKEDKLTALREIALRMTAERVDQDLQKFVSIRSDGPAWRTSERLLVGLSHSPYSEKLLRATRRLAYNLEAPWIALHVDTGITLNDEDQAQLVKNLNLARELKAEVITITDLDVASAIQQICRRKNVTQVIVGRPTRRWFRDLLEGGSLIKRLMRESLDLDIHILRQEGEYRVRPRLTDEVLYYRSQTGLIKYWFTLWAVLGTSFMGGFLNEFLGYKAVGFFFLLSVIVIGMFGSLGAVVFAAFLSALIWDFFFIPPSLTLTISKADDILMCVSFFVVAVITGFLTNRIRFHEKVIREREERTSILYEVLQDITSSTEKSEFLKKVLERIGHLLDADCGVLLKSPAGTLDFGEAKAYGIWLDEKDQAVAQWCFDNQKRAGWSTDTLAQSRNYFLPLKGLSETVGVFIFQARKKKRKLDLEKENLLLSIIRQLGVSVERHFLTKRLAESQRLQDSEKLHQTLLNSISHEMRTPLTAILGTASALENEEMTGGNQYVKNVARELQDAGERLNRVIENLLDMSRLNSGVMSLRMEWHDFNDLLGVVTKKLARALVKHTIKIQFPDDIPLVRIDFRLMEHAISNLLMNAVMYTPPGTEIRASLRKVDSKFIFELEDNGPGVPEDSVPKIFDKFYRVPGSPTGGTGLGLSLVKSIVELHGGSVRFENVAPHGARFVIELPSENPPEGPEEIA